MAQGLFTLQEEKLTNSVKKRGSKVQAVMSCWDTTRPPLCLREFQLIYLGDLKARRSRRDALTYRRISELSLGVCGG